MMTILSTIFINIFLLYNYFSTIIKLIGSWIIFCGLHLIIPLAILYFSTILVTITITYLSGKKPGISGIAAGVTTVVGITQLIDFAQRQQDRKARPNPTQPGKGSGSTNNGGSGSTNNGGTGSSSGGCSGSSGGQTSGSSEGQTSGSNG